GDRMIPPLLWKTMAAAARIELTAPRESRARYLVEAYRDIIEDRAALDTALARLPIQPSPARLAAWRALADAGEFATLAEALMELHYDPAYARSAKKSEAPRLAGIGLEAVTAGALDGAAEAIARAVAAR